MTASPIPDAAVEAFLRAEYTAHLVADTGLPVDDSVVRRRVDERIARCREFPGVWEQTRAGLAAAYAHWARSTSRCHATAEHDCPAAQRAEARDEQED